MRRSQPVTTDSSGPKTGPNPLVWKRILKNLRRATLVLVSTPSRLAPQPTGGNRRREADATTRRTSAGTRRAGSVRGEVAAVLLEALEGGADLLLGLEAADPLGALDGLSGLEVLVDLEEVLDLEAVE